MSPSKPWADTKVGDDLVRDMYIAHFAVLRYISGVTNPDEITEDGRGFDVEHQRYWVRSHVSDGSREYHVTSFPDRCGKIGHTLQSIAL